MKNNMKKIVTIFLAFATLFMACIPVFALESENEDEMLRETIHRYAMARFNDKMRIWMENSKIVEKEYVTAEEVIALFESELGYRPEYTEQRWYEGHWSLTVYFTHLAEDIVWDWEIENPNDNGWRILRDRFEEVLEDIRPIYLTPQESVEEKYYTTDEVEELFFEKYGYDIHVYQCKYWNENEVEVNFVICDLYNGREFEIDAVQLEDGEWYLTETVWQEFIENVDLSEEVQYATEDVEFWTYEEIVEKFTDMLGYTPNVSVSEEDLEWFHSIDFSFDHLGGKKYYIDWVIIEEDGDVLVTDKVFSEFLEDNPEVTVVPRFTKKQLDKMYEFYLERIKRY